MLDQNNRAFKPALKFVVLLGIVSLFADVTYEGARSITGPYLALLGASAAVVGFAAGFGELVGYGLRLISGYLSDRTRKYWALTLTGYTINLLAVPLLALAGNWPVAAALVITERIGKAIRTPARDAMLSYATHQSGHGWGFGLHEALDQIGAMLGPLIVAAILYFQGTYRVSFAVLLLPALLALVTLLMARSFQPKPWDLEPTLPSLQARGLSRPFWLYVLGVGLVAAGYADFPLIAFHFEKLAVTSPAWTPVFYSVAMAVDAFAALVFGRLFDRFGMLVIVASCLISVFFAPLVFLGGFHLALLGMVLWGVGMGAQESIMRAFIASLVSSERRGTAFGIFNAVYGLLWFLGSLAMGTIYDISIPLVVVFSMAAQGLAIPLFVFGVASSKSG